MALDALIDLHVENLFFKFWNSLCISMGSGRACPNMILSTYCWDALSIQAGTQPREREQDQRHHGEQQQHQFTEEIAVQSSK